MDTGDLGYVPSFHSRHKQQDFSRRDDVSLLDSFISTALLAAAGLAALGIIELFSPKSPAQMPSPKTSQVEFANLPSCRITASAGRVSPTRPMNENARVFTRRAARLIVPPSDSGLRSAQQSVYK